MKKCVITLFFSQRERDFIEKLEQAIDEKGNKIRVRAREDLALAFQHEIDHLDGILFYDRINKDHPFYSEDEIRLI